MQTLDPTPASKAQAAGATESSPDVKAAEDSESHPLVEKSSNDSDSGNDGDDDPILEDREGNESVFFFLWGGGRVSFSLPDLPEGTAK